MKVGIVGTGNMGGILIEAFIESGAISPSDLNVVNRTRIKAEKLLEKYRGISIYNEPADVIQNSDAVFICVKPLDIFELLKSNQHHFSKEKCIVSITSPVSVEQVESLVDCSCMRVIPSITNRALSGVSLFSIGTRCTEEWKTAIWQLLSTISTPISIDENITRVSSDIVSCGPAFFTYLTRKFIDGAVSETEIDEATATVLASEMLIGLGELLKKEIYTLAALQEKVCVKGGVTGEGISAMEKQIGSLFNELFKATHRKFDEDLSETKKQFGV
ncbi:late competence protein ComER [Rossellomorea vietnamensis]|uniref:Late competence protein ComER n=1 Tax=Rossellomorea vietnamensis TaxID=218284 RepID=A0A5D4MGI3_9BACI|nr:MULTISPECIES: late competence protein ComER [Bacillaceae]TYS00823.1 late competence protein ComER [Rossellomorea vietnamensis]